MVVRRVVSFYGSTPSEALNSVSVALYGKPLTIPDAFWKHPVGQTVRFLHDLHNSGELSAREFLALVGRNILGVAQSQIGRILGFSQIHVSRIERNGVAIIKATQAPVVLHRSIPLSEQQVHELIKGLLDSGFPADERRWVAGGSLFFNGGLGHKSLYSLARKNTSGGTLPFFNHGSWSAYVQRGLGFSFEPAFSEWTDELLHSKALLLLKRVGPFSWDAKRETLPWLGCSPRRLYDALRRREVNGVNWFGFGSKRAYFRGVHNLDVPEPKNAPRPRKTRAGALLSQFRKTRRF